MYRYFFIAKNNIKKQKSDMITFFILSAIAALLLFISLTFLTGTGKVIDCVAEKINGADLLTLVYDDEAVVNKLEECVKGNVYLKGFETQDYLAGTMKYRKKGSGDWTEYAFAVLCFEDECKVQTMSTGRNDYPDNGIVIPISLSTSYSLGDTFQLKLGDYVYEYTVVDFNEDNFFCSPMNMGTIKIYVSEREYEKLNFTNRLSRYKLAKVQFTDTARKMHLDMNTISNDIGDEMISWFNEAVKADPGMRLSLTMLPSELMRTASMILPLVFVALVFLFAVIILVIATVIINFSVKNFIMTNMKNTAIMEASGYTVRELVLILMCQLLLVSLLGTVLGVFIGILATDKVGIIILITLGLKWNQPVNLTAAVIVLAGIVLAVCILTLVLGKEYSRTSVLDALRGGVNTHNYKKNRFAFDKTSLPISMTLAFKETFGKFRSQLGVIFIMLILTVSTIFAFGCMDTYGTDEGVMEMGGFDVQDAITGGGESMVNEITAMSTVENARRELTTNFNIYNKSVKQTVNVRAISDTSLIRGGCVIEGRWPVYDNEITFASNAANALRVEVGDTVTVKTDEVEEAFIVCGINQSMQNMGMTGIVTMEGVTRLMPVPDNVQICINFKPGVTFAQFEKEFHKQYPDKEVQDFNVVAGQTTGLITMGLKAFAYFIAILTILIVAFVESLIVRTNINRQWRDLGVSKALGFTSSQLIGQVMMSNMPAITMGVLIGLFISPFAGGKMIVLSMSIFGFRKTNFNVSPMSYILTLFIIIGVALLTAALKGRRIKTLEPVKMINEE